MNLHTLPKLTQSTQKRLGRGHGSGRGKTSGRGTKGQKARGDIKLSFEGGALPLIKRIPFLRGKNRNKVFKAKSVVISVESLNVLPKNTTVDLEALGKYNIVKLGEAQAQGVKILGTGELNVPLTVKLRVSKSAQAKIEKAGGTVEAA